MRLAKIEMKNYRSIRQASIEESGNLNVLIGKNNSGKSNVLNALERFFGFFAQGSVAVRDNSLKVTDCFKKEKTSEISIAIDFELALDESSALRESIGHHAPQMRNALAEISEESIVRCVVSFLKSDTPIGYIDSIVFLDGVVGEASGLQNKNHMLFKMSQQAAEVMAGQLQQRRALEAQATRALGIMEPIDLDEWQMIKGDPSTPGRRPSVSLRHLIPGGVPSEVVDIITNAVESSTNITSFKEAVRSQVETLQHEAQALASRPNPIPFQAFSGEVTAVPEYVNLFIGMVAGLKVHYLPETRSPIGESEAADILQLKMSRGHGERLRGLQETVRSLLGVEIDAFAADQPTQRNHGITRIRSNVPAELDVDEFLAQINGSGIRQSLRLILDYEFKQPDIILIEEPEVYLHPALEIALLQYLRQISQRCQVFITTHSTNFLDTAELRNVYLVRKVDDSTSLQLLKMDEAEEAIPEELGIRLSSLFMYDRLVFVEGSSDEQVLREFAKQIGVNFAQASVGFVATGGSRNFTHYATADTLSFLARRRVKVFFIVDRDERDANDVERLEQLLGGMGKVYVLQRRELENYLAVPECLQSFVAERSPDKTPSAEEITNTIDEVCEASKHNVVARRVSSRICQPMFLDREAIRSDPDSDLESAVEHEFRSHEERLKSFKNDALALVGQAKEEVESSWAANKVNLIPGDELLKGVLRRCGINFKKTRDGATIARHFGPEHIAHELQMILREIGDS
ncbi:hypothetical protein GCM10022254_37700 [Actinomadura meridiana]|uniref:AAA domain-containing protein n=1 Tax=Actinomadura meridiana TaxID=559626 RepID=A0ABP8C5E1_9ACTN